MKTKQQTLNFGMIILLLFLLLQQSFNILSLNIGLHSEPIIDIRFFVVLTAFSFLLLTVPYFLIAICIIKWTINIHLYIPLKKEYYISAYELYSTSKFEKKYQRLEVIRC